MRGELLGPIYSLVDPFFNGNSGESFLDQLSRKFLFSDNKLVLKSSKLNSFSTICPS